MTTFQRQFAKEGVVFLPKALDARAMQLAEECFNWSVDHPGPGAGNVLAGTAGEFYQDHANPDAFPVYRGLLAETKLPELICDIMGSESLWLLYEQIWLKDGGETRPTPWHQDLAYVPMVGDHIVTVWLNLDPVPMGDSLGFIPGSHRGPLFNPTAFHPKDSKAAMFPDGVWPALPDIAANREQFNIVSWPIEPGDLIIFHPAILHGGAATSGHRRRRTISLRYFGDRTYCAERPKWVRMDIERRQKEGHKPDPIEQMVLEQPGTLFRHAAFPRLR